VAIATNISGLLIILANGWMQNPVGYVLRNNRAEMVDFGALVTNPIGWLQFGHTLSSAYVLAAFFVMGISAYHLLKSNKTDFFKKSFRIAATVALIFSILVFIVGDFSAVHVANTQPAKFAAMESVWETQSSAPYNLLVVPDEQNERNSLEAIAIPNMLSYLAFHDATAQVTGLKAVPTQDRPPVLITFLSFRVMVGLGMLIILLSIIAFVVSKRDSLEANPTFLRIMLYSIPLPYIAIQLGWIVTEVGRQPWIVYGVLRTSDAVSKAISPTQVWGSLIGFTLLYGSLGIIDIYLLAKYAKNGPDDDLSAIIKTSRMEA
jgi:cytochrome d ubiquinol oxidase subunit I